MKYITVGNTLLLAFFGLSFFASLAEGGPNHHLLATIDLVLVIFTLLEDHQSLAQYFPPFDFSFLKGSVYLTAVGLYASALGVSFLFSGGAANYLMFLLGAYASASKVLQACEAYNVKNKTE